MSAGESGEAFMTSLVVFKPVSKDLSKILMVAKFLEIFPKELLGLPPKKKVEFEIELALDKAPILKAPYRMIPTEHKELKMQLEELLQAVFILPSSSLWEALVLFSEEEGWISTIMHRLLTD